MEKYYKQKNKKVTGDISFQIIEWYCGDEEVEEELSEEEEEEMIKKEYIMRCFGVTKEGVSVTCKIKGFKCFYYVKVDDTFGKKELSLFLNYLETHYLLKQKNSDGEYCEIDALVKSNGKHKSCIVEKKDLFGFTNGKKFRFVKLMFNNHTFMTKSRYIFKKPLQIKGVNKTACKYKLYESNVEPFMRYCHIKEILMSGWITLEQSKYKLTHNESKTQIEVEIDKLDIISLKEKKDITNFLQASFDIEVYSCDNSFPEPDKKVIKNGKESYPNEIYQIATTYKNYNDKDIFVKHLLTLKKCDSIDDEKVIVEECENEKELITKWVDTISKLDPDILYTYNGDAFDFMYIVERCKLISSSFVKYVFQKLSRSNVIQATIKKEIFQSSAYGDNEYNRVYIPGRLNYDLLIHYKRGMKKYSSYKLDNIANEVLKEGKTEGIGAKEIFKYYEDGSPDKIKQIAEYCIQDTVLLQKLVDAQLILITIIQLANVTYVPISYLTTKGQTIKVFSQILRKARQMDFLVPHTNFNSDIFPIYLEFKSSHNLPLNAYIDITYGSKNKLNGKVTEIINDNLILILSDSLIEKEYVNCTLKYKYENKCISKMFAQETEDSFTGATVLTPQCGLHTDNVAVLDYASLYPTVEMSRNLCYSSMVVDKNYLNIPGVKYETIEWNDQISYKMNKKCEAIGKSGKSKGQVCGKPAFFEEDEHYFCRIHDPLKKTRPDEEKFQKKDIFYSFIIVQPHTDSEGNVINKGVVPALLEELYSERKKVKKLMFKASQENNKLLENIYDSTQLAIKVSLNSVYGFVSRGKGNLIMKPLGQLTTYIGRTLIEDSKAYVEGLFMEFIRNEKMLEYTVKMNETGLDETQKDDILNKFEIK